jgi:hypothetical protein
MLAALVCRSVSAQSPSQVFATAGAGATSVSGGVDWRVTGGPIGLGGEVGVGNLLVTSLIASYHPVSRRSMRMVDPFATVSITAVNDLNYTATGFSLGGGLTTWLNSRFGLRVDAFKFLPTRDDITRLSVDTSPRYWGVRGGVAIAF